MSFDVVTLLIRHIHAVVPVVDGRDIKRRFLGWRLQNRPWTSVPLLPIVGSMALRPAAWQNHDHSFSDWFLCVSNLVEGRFL